ncbi:MAG: HlyD family efflux transporter periplasmic adaptor subunit [Limnohabitans sp.]
MKLFKHSPTNAISAPAHASDRSLSTVIWGSVIGLGLFITWAAVADLDQITRASGQIIASSRKQIIQSSDGGVLTELLVREGATVQRGQVLARLDKTRAQATYRETQSRVAALRAAVTRLRSELYGDEPQFDEMTRGYPQFVKAQQALLQKRRTAIAEELSALRKMRDLVQSELNMTEPLLKTGDVSRADVLRLQRQEADFQAQMTNRNNRYLQDLQADLAKAQEELAGAEQLMVQKAEQVQNTQITAPVTGVISSIKMMTIGGVLRVGEELMQIVPVEEDLLVEVRVKPAEVAFLKPGLPATVKIDAYDYTIYGTLAGKVSYISADTLNEDLRQGEQAYYRVQVVTKGRHFSASTQLSQNLELQTGMTATVEIKTGSNTVLRYITKPIVKTLSEALGER